MFLQQFGFRDAKCRLVEWSAQHLCVRNHNRRMMSVDFEWHFGPHSNFPSQLVHFVGRVHSGLRCLSHQERQRRQQLWQTLHTQPEQMTVQGSKLRQLKWSDLGFSVSASM